MFGATLTYRTGNIHLGQPAWPEDTLLCPETHTSVEPSHFWFAQDVVRSMGANPAAIADLRWVLARETSLYSAQRLTNPEILKYAANLVAQGRLKALGCNVAPPAEAAIAAATLSLKRSQFHFGLEVGGGSCPHRLSHRVHQFVDAGAATDFLMTLFQEPETAQQLREMAASPGEQLPLTDDKVRERLAGLIVAGQLLVLECPMGTAARIDEADREAEQALREQQERQAALAARGAPRKKTDQDKKAVKTWVEIRLVDQDGNPVPNEKYRLKLPDGSITEGTLDKNGRARHDDIDPGQCEVSFPDIDAREWKPA